MTAGVALRVVDATDERQLRGWWEVGAAASAERPPGSWRSWEAQRLSLSLASPEFVEVLVCAWDGDEAVGATMVHLPQQDQPHVAYADLMVHPDRRREGIGSALLADVEQRARDAGRTVVLVESLAAPGVVAVGERFGAVRGYAVANREQLKALDVVAWVGHHRSLREQVGTAPDGYRVVTWDTGCPEEHVEAFCELLSRFMDEVPLGDMALESSVWTVERLRANEARARTIGKRMLVAAAVAPDGSLAGASDIRVVEADPTGADVGFTLVVPAHRGHGLGLVLKLAAEEMLLAGFPGCRSLRTSNAGVNDHMNAINERLGYRVVEDLLELQKVLV